MTRNQVLANQKRSNYLKVIWSIVAVLFIALAVFAAFSDAVLGFQALMGAFGTAMIAAVVGGCILVALVVSVFYLLQDGVTLWRRMRGEEGEDEDDENLSAELTEAQRTEAYGNARLKKASLWNWFWLSFREFWLGESYQNRAYQLSNFVGRIISLIAAFAAGGGAYLAVETLLNLFGVTSGLGLLIPCAMAAVGLGLAFISQDGFSLVKRLRSLGEAFSKPRQNTIIQSVRNYFQNMTGYQLALNIVTVVLIGVAALAVTGDAFLGVQTLLNVMGMSSPQIVIALSISLAVLLGIIWVAQEGFSLSKLVNTLSIMFNNFFAFFGLTTSIADQNASKPGLSISAERGLKAFTITFGLVAAFAVAGGAYLGLEMLFTSVGFTGGGMIAISATAAVVAGFGFLAQDGRVFYERIRDRIVAWYADKNSDRAEQAPASALGDVAGPLALLAKEAESAIRPASPPPSIADGAVGAVGGSGVQPLATAQEGVADGEDSDSDTGREAQSLLAGNS